MTPVLALWPDDAPAALRADVDARMADSGFAADAYRSIACKLSADTAAATRVMLSEQYTELINLDATDTTMHVALVLPLWLPDAAARAEALMQAAGEITHDVTIDILGLQSALDIDAPAADEPAKRETERRTIDTLAARCAASAFPCRIFALDNYNATGAAAGFTDRLLAKFISALLRIMTESFADTFARLNPAAAPQPPVGAAGIAVLEFRRDRMADYLLSRAFVSALDEAGVMQEQVDAQGAAERARVCLEGIERFYDEFYDTQVEPLIASGLPEGEIAARIRKPLDEAVAALHARLAAFMDDRKLSLPEKEATWAVILGRDNKLLDGTLYKQRAHTFDDVFTAPARLFIDAFNSYAAGSGLLPERRQYPALAFPEDDGEEDPRNKQAFDPLDDIKTLKAELLDITAYMRSKEREIETLRDNSEKGDIAEGHLSEEGFVFKGVARRLEATIVEEPLQETYTPAPGLKPLPSVDLRRFFSPVRDQGPVGSCTAFAVIGMYESIVNRNSPGLDSGANLSERFIFYHTNISRGRANEGSSFSDQLNALGRVGTCREEFYPYVPELLNEPPTEAAAKDALTHRVTLARQVPLRSDGDKYECVKANHIMLTSALSEGYPVGISLMLFDDFGSQPGGHVPRPSDDAVAHAEHGHHAMVLVGYSERDNCYIVRNSWGEDFGDKGYAYISAAYIDDPELCRFACIIADTTDGPATGGMAGGTPVLVAPFAGTETQIKIASASNALDMARIHFKWIATRYEELYRYYADLMQRLGQPFVRNELRSISEQASADRLVRLAEHKRELVDTLPAKMRAFRHDYIKGALIASVTALILLLAAGATTYFDGPAKAQTYCWVAAAIAVVAAIAIWAHYKWAKRRKRLELQTEVDDVAAAIGREERTLLTMQLRFHVGGMVIDAMHRLSLELEADYQRLMSYNNNLRCWHEEDERRAAALETGSEAMFVNLTDPRLLDAFFEEHRAEVTSRVRLLDAFAGYTLSTDGMADVRRSLEDDTRAAIVPLFADFSMAAYIMGTRRYPYLPEPALDTTLKRLNRMARVLTRHRSADSAFESKHLIACVPATERHRWLQLCTPHFEYQPMTLPTPDADRLTLLTLNLIPATDLIL